MQNWKRILVALLATMTVLPMVACGSAGSTDAETTAAQTGNSETAPVTTTEEVIPEPSYDFEGKHYRVLMNEGYIFQMYAEEQTGDVTNDAIYARNVKYEEKYNYETEAIIRPGATTDIWKYLNPIVLAGDDTFDIAGHYAYNNYQCISQRTLMNWKEIPNINLEADYWNQEIIDAATMNDRCYAITGYLSTTLMQLTYGIFFNTNLCTNYGYTADKLYKAVEDGKWTLDYLATAVQGMYKDLNGDGKRDVADQYGFATMPDNSPDFWYAAVEQPVTQRNKEGKWEVVFNTQKSVDLIEKLLDLYYVNAGGMNYETITSYVTDGGDKYFSEGLVCFIPSTFLAAFNTYRDMEDDYGILPPPKWNEAQEGYHSHVKDKYTVYSVPVTEKDPAFVGAVTDALCKETKESVYTQFFDTALKSKYSRDASMAEMVDIIMDGVVFDAGFTFGSYINGVQVMVRAMIKANDHNFASTYASKVFTLDDYYQYFYD